MLQKFKFHLKNYFNLGVHIPPMYFAVLYCVVTFACTPLLIAIVDPEQLQGLMDGTITRLDIAPRLFFASYEVLLIPLYIKRFSDFGWEKTHRDIALIALLTPVFLATVLSAGGYELLTPVIGFFRLLAFMLTFVLFVFPTKK